MKASELKPGHIERLEAGMKYQSLITKVYFCRRVSDGLFYRGAKWWRWCKDWRKAAVMPAEVWGYFISHSPVIGGQDVELVTLDQLYMETERE